MKKIQLKLNPTQLNGIMAELAKVIAFPQSYGYTNDDNDKLILAALTELYYQLHGKADLFATGYKIKINVSYAMAFSIHFSALPAASVAQTVALAITSIIGDINQKIRLIEYGQTTTTDRGDRGLATQES